MKMLPRTLLIEPDIRDYFSILVLTYKHPPPQKKKLEAQGPCTGHRSIIATLHCFPLHEKYTNECRLNTLPHKYNWKEVSGND